MPAILPALIFLGGSAVVPFIKGRARQVYMLAIGLLGLIDVLLLKPQSSWTADFIGFKVTLLHADRISLFTGYIFVIIGFLAILYTIHVEETWHHLLALWYVGSSLGAVFSGDLLSLYLFWELMAVASAGLVFLKDTEESKGAAYRYLLMHLIGGAVMIGGIFLHYMNTGSLAIGPMEGGLAFDLMLFGVGMNSAFVLLHTWLPDAYPRAPFTASVFMSVYTTKTAVYALARLAPGWEFVAWMGAAMTVFGVTMALTQNNARKLLSYHIVSQVGYMVAAIGLGGIVGVNGGLFHLFNHILYKALLFMTIGAVIYRLGKEDLTDLGGVWRKMPVTTAAAVVASLSISGAPLFNGFVSKSMIFTAAETNVNIEVLLELAAVGTFLSFLKFTYFGFFQPNEENEAKATEVPAHMQIAMGTTAALCVAIGIAPQFFVGLLPFALPAAEASFYTLPKVAGVMQIMVMTIVLFFVALSVFSPHRRRTYDFDWFYMQAGRGLQVLAEGVNRLNNGFESGFSLLPPAIMSLRRPLFKLNELASRLIFAVFVDMWLYRPVTQRAVETIRMRLPRLSEETGGVTQATPQETDGGDNVAAAPSVRVLGLDVGLFDVLVTQFAVIGERISALSGWCDKYIIDGVVNAVGWVTKKVGGGLRPIQTGDVQSYGVVMVGGALVLLAFFALAFYGIFKLV